MCIGNSRIETRAMILCHLTPESLICNGFIADRTFSISLEHGVTVPKCEDLQIIIDRRKSETKVFHVYSKEISTTLNELSKLKQNLIIAYVENSSYAQLTIFNSELHHKISEIVVRRESTINDLRSYAYTLVSAIYPRFLSLIEENKDETENENDDDDNNHDLYTFAMNT